MVTARWCTSVTSQLKIVRLYESVALTKSEEGKFVVLAIAFSIGNNEDSGGDSYLMSSHLKTRCV